MELTAYEQIKEIYGMLTTPSKGQPDNRQNLGTDDIAYIIGMLKSLLTTYKPDESLSPARDTPIQGLKKKFGVQ